MELRAQLKQQQKLVMTFQMRQVFKLLQMNSIELDQALNELLEENTSLEMSDDASALSEQEMKLLQKEKETQLPALILKSGTRPASMASFSSDGPSSTP